MASRIRLTEFFKKFFWNPFLRVRRFGKRYIWDPAKKLFLKISAPLRKKKWTIMIYAVANEKDSESAIKDFLKDLDDIESSSEINTWLLAYQKWGETNNEKYSARLFEVKKGYLNHPKDWGNREMGSEEILAAFINWCKELYPAKNYMLLLWGHGTGSGMFEYEAEEKFVQAKKEISLDFFNNDNEPVSLIDIKSFFGNRKKIILKVRYKYESKQNDDEIIIYKSESADAGGKKNILYSISPTPKTLSQTIDLLQGYYSTKNHIVDGLTHAEISRSIEAVFNNEKNKQDRKLDLVTIMGCSNQMIEFGYQLRNHCRYLVASEENIWFKGYDYKGFFGQLARNPGLNAEELGKSIITLTADGNYYQPDEKEELAISCADLSKSEDLATRLELWVNNLMKLNNSKVLVTGARDKCLSFGEGTFQSYIDLVWFLKNMQWQFDNANTGDQKLIQETQELIDFISPPEGKAGYIIEKRIGREKREGNINNRSLGGNGVSIYFPKSRSEHQKNGVLGEYFDVKNKNANDFVKEYTWDDMVKQSIL
jgi:hypothetical protein